jgi:hypothetical protein
MGLLVEQIKVVEGNRPKAVLDKLYAILGTLDNTATGLLTAEGLVGAIVAIVLTANDKPPRWCEVSMWVSLIPTFASAFYCMLIIRIKWPFLHYVDVTVGATNPLDGEISELESLVSKRTCWLKNAWTWAMIGIMAPAILILLWQLESPALCLLHKLEYFASYH